MSRAPPNRRSKAKPRSKLRKIYQQRQNKESPKARDLCSKINKGCNDQFGRKRSQFLLDLEGLRVVFRTAVKRGFIIGSLMKPDLCSALRRITARNKLTIYTTNKTCQLVSNQEFSSQCRTSSRRARTAMGTQWLPFGCTSR